MPRQRTDQRNIDAEIFDGMMKSFPAQRCTLLTQHVILEDGSTLEVSFSAVNGEILYGDDRKLLQWLLDRALETGEADVSWETLLEYLGPNPTSSQKKAIFEAVSRIGVTGVDLDHKDVLMSMNMVNCTWSSQPEITLEAAEDDFQGEIGLVLNSGLLQLMRSAKTPKTVAPLWPVKG